MKSILSFCIILVLIQTLMAGSLVRIELQDITPKSWEGSGIRKQVILDPYLMPEKDGIAQNIQLRNEWISFHYTNNFALKNNTLVPVAFEIRVKSGSNTRYKTKPVFILNNTLRL